MIARVFTSTLQGLDAKQVTVEVDVSSGIPGLTIVGLPDTAISEAKERVKAAIKNSGFPFPLKKLVINLAPADIRKEGTGFDLPISVGILLAADVLSPTDWIEQACFIGELSLEGAIRPVNGVLSMTLMAKEQGFKAVVVPEANLMEASLVEGIEVFGLKHLRDLPVFLVHPQSFSQPVNRHQLLDDLQQSANVVNALVDFADVKGQAQAKRALEIAAAGGHNILMVGPPGSGKSMLSKALWGILPPLSFDEMLEVSRIYSVAGLLSRDRTQAQGLITQRPFRSPHHSASSAGITGGGSHPKPGEITLAHRGVLFLDEFVEFPRPILEVLRQPLEDGVITISRAQQSNTFPAKMLLVAALNPCPCGYRGDGNRPCTCSENQVQRYISKLSGPILDRIDLHIEVPRLKDVELLASDRPGANQAVASLPESSRQIRERVVAGRQRQLARFAGMQTLCNADMSAAEVKQFCVLDDACETLMKRAITKLNLSARAFDRVLRLTRTIADLDDSREIQPAHLAEALQYRATDRLFGRLSDRSSDQLSGQLSGRSAVAMV